MAVSVVLLATTVLTLSLSRSLAWAGSGEDTIPTDTGITTGEWLLRFVGIPLVVVALVFLVVLGLGSARGPRYRPGLTWWAEPVWINGPEGAALVGEAVPATQGGGGASARW